VRSPRGCGGWLIVVTILVSLVLVLKE